MPKRFRGNKPKRDERPDGWAIPRSVRHRNIVGKLINFRGLVYAPVNENGVILLFGKVASDLNMYVETIRTGFPDCIAKRYLGKGRWEEVRIEFEFKSSDFVRHRHNPDDCDAIVCWEHDWNAGPRTIEIINLQELYVRLPNQVIEEPDKVTELSEHNVSDLFKGRDDAASIYKDLHPAIMRIHSDIWRKVGEKYVTYYSPERVFALLRVQKQGLLFTVFTSGKTINGVDQIDYERGGRKWGRLYVKSKAEIQTAKKALSRSWQRLVEATKRGENTGWYAEED